MDTKVPVAAPAVIGTRVDTDLCQAAEVPDTAATRVLRTVLGEVEATTVQLAEAAGIGRSTAGKLLALLEKAGAAQRIPGLRRDGKYVPDRWLCKAPVSQEELDTTNEEPESVLVPLQAEPEEDQAETIAHEPRQAQRLRPGELQEMVLQFLQDRPNQTFTPTGISKVLDRSSGAVGNCCIRLTAAGSVILAIRKPRRYCAVR